MISALFVVAYRGISVPVIGVGLLVSPIGLESAGLVFIACMVPLVVIAALCLVRHPVARPADERPDRVGSGERRARDAGP